MLCCLVTYRAEKPYSTNSQLINTHLPPAVLHLSRSYRGCPTSCSGTYLQYAPLASFSHHWNSLVFRPGYLMTRSFVSKGAFVNGWFRSHDRWQGSHRSREGSFIHRSLYLGSFVSEGGRQGATNLFETLIVHRSHVWCTYRKKLP